MASQRTVRAPPFGANPHPAPRKRGGRAAAAVGVPLEQAHLRPGHRRPPPADLAAASTLDKELRARAKTGANKDAAAAVGKLVAERAKGRRQGRGLRPRRLSVSRPRQGAGRSRPRSRPELLEEGNEGWHGMQGEERGRRSRAVANRADSIVEKAGPHQPRRQGGEGRPPLRLCGAGRGRRRQGPRRLRHGQGARGARGDPQGDRAGQAQHDPRPAARRPDAASRRQRPLRRRQGGAARRAAGHRHHRRRPDARGLSRRWACRTWSPSRSARPTRTT